MNSKFAADHLPEPSIPDRLDKATNPEETPVAGDVLTQCLAVDALALTRTVLGIFRAHPDLIGLPIIDQETQRPIGLISQALLMGSLAKPFYKEIYLDQSCLVFMDKNPLVVEFGLPLQEVSILIAERGDKVGADGFVIVADGRYQGMGHAQDVLRLMAVVHRQHSRRLAQHRDNLEALVLERTLALVEARDAAEAAARAKSSFLANMSHEIRTPMNGIMGMTYLMKRDELSAKQAARLEIIDRSAQHLLTIINDILDLSKINAGQMTLVEEPLHLTTLMASIAEMMGPLAASKGLLLVQDTPAIAGTLFGDSTRLTQALLNYVSNAVKFTERGTVSLRYRMLAENTTSILVRFEVQDSGIGISREALSGLFSAFRQADASMTRKYGGTGLGLAITRHLAELMDGEAGAESTPGEGSLFWFTARLKRSLDANAITFLAPSANPGRASTPLNSVKQIRECYPDARILVVEDEPINRNIALEILEEAGFVVDIAVNGREAVARVKSELFDLILMDMQMPEMDGLTATGEIRRLHFGQNLPIIAMTANAFEQDRERCLAAGMDDFITKPFDPDLLYACLLHWLDRQADCSLRRNRPQRLHETDEPAKNEGTVFCTTEKLQ